MTDRMTEVEQAMGSREQGMADAMAEVEKAMEIQEDRANKDIAKFTQELATNPGYAFEWADAAVQAAASFDEVAMVRRRMVEVLSGVIDVGDFYESVQREIAHWLPSHVSGSTSPMANLVGLARAVVASKWLDPDPTLIGRTRLMMAVRKADL